MSDGVAYQAHEAVLPIECPLVARVCPSDEEERKARTPWHFSAMVRYGVLFGRVLTTAGEPRGVAVWLPPGETAMTDDRIAAAGLDASPAVLGEEAFGRFMSVMAQIEPYREQDVPPQHWYLALVGVDPDCSGEGIGGSLLRPILAVSPTFYVLPPVALPQTWEVYHAPRTPGTSASRVEASGRDPEVEADPLPGWVKHGDIR